jgi:hypothetical protein
MAKTAKKPNSNLLDGAPVPSDALKATAVAGANPGALLAKIALRPSVRAAVTTRIFSKQFGELEIDSLVDQLASQANAVTQGDLQRAEAMLVAQAHTLEAIFHELARRSALNLGEYLGAAETYMRLALKAQSQCRATLETLATMKNPHPVAFVRQANIAHGPQQVNNGPAPNQASRARESENPPNKLLEQHDNEWMDARTAGAAGSISSSVETVGAVNGTKDDRG